MVYLRIPLKILARSPVPRREAEGHRECYRLRSAADASAAEAPSKVPPWREPLRFLGPAVDGRWAFLGESL